MSSSSNSPLLPPVEEQQAGTAVSALYDQIRLDTGLPFVQNLVKTLAVSEAALGIHGQLLAAVQQRSTLPRSLIAMLLYVVARCNNSIYGSAREAFHCHTLGIHEDALQAWFDGTLEPAPRRLGAVLEFARQAATTPRDLTPADLDTLQRQGLRSDEIVEILQVVALGGYLDTLSEALHVDVDAPFLAR